MTSALTTPGPGPELRVELSLDALQALLEGVTLRLVTPEASLFLRIDEEALLAYLPVGGTLH